MCGIIALLRGPGTRSELPAADVLGRLDAIATALAPGADVLAAAEASAGLLEELDGVLRTTSGVALLVRDRELGTRVDASCASVGDWTAGAEAALDRGEAAGEGSPGRP